MATTLWDKGEALNELVQRFTVGSDPDLDRTLVRWDAIGSAAHCRMLRSIGVLSQEEETKLLGELNEILCLADKGEFTIPVELEDCHTAIESRLVDKLGETGKKIHTGRSRNDQVLLAMRLFLRDRVVGVAELLASLSREFLERAEMEQGQFMPGYTHMQPAMPSSFGMWLHAFGQWSVALLEDGRRLLQAMDRNPLGAASGFGSPIALDREMTTQLLEFKQTHWNPIDVQNSRGRYELKALYWLNEVASMMEKFALDVLVYSTREFSLLSLPKELTTGSSIMPQKRNPDVAELIRARSAKVRGATSELEWLIAKLPSNYHRDFQYSKEPVFRAFAEVSETLLVTELLVKSFEINVERLEDYRTPEMYATYFAFDLVEKGMPFRDAYRKTAEAYQAQGIDVDRLKDKFEPIAQDVTLAIAKSFSELEISTREISAQRLLFRSVEDNIFGTAR